jgi:TonB dependent receptor/CarboxypepD_reg-like domain/TonB-dependent Receptor Plug Domain
LAKRAKKNDERVGHWKVGVCHSFLKMKTPNPHICSKLKKINSMNLQTKVFLFLFSVLSIFASSTKAQTFTISGSLKDAASGEALIGASVRIQELPSVGAAANEYGFYSLTLKSGTYTLKATYIGYQDFVQKIVLDKDQKLEINLADNATITEVVVSARKENEQVTQAQMGVEKLDVAEIAKIPVLFGEKDVLKTIQLLPGVKSAGEGSSGFYVRGGAADQNLILLDEAPVYNASHLLGFFSTFNSDAIKDVTLIKGNSPAQYGGRLASVLDVKMNEGNDKKYRVKGGLGVISSRLSIEGPIQKEKSSFLVTGRRTYADVFLKLSDKFKDNKLYFYDLNGKANYRINANNRVFLSGYFGRDVLGVGKDIGIDWGNKTATLRWNSLIGQKWFSNTSLIYSDYNYNIKIKQSASTFNINSEIKDINLKQEFQYFPNTRNSWRFGFNTIHHALAPSRFTSNGTTDQMKETRYALENAVYANNSFRATDKLNIDYGLRVSSYSLIGAGTFNTYDNGALTGTKTLKENEFGKTYLNLEPRLSASFIMDENSSLKAGYSRNTQNLHLLSNSTTGNPTDSWIGNSYNIKPEIADQASMGYFRNFADNKFELSTEIYYKDMQNQVDYKNGADINTAPDLESELLYGKGRAYGLEMNLKKKNGRFTGWVSYTLSKTERQIEGVNNGDWYNAKQDRTHDVSLVGIYQLSKKWSLASTWVYYTGNAVTFPSGKYNINDQTILFYTERNGYRMPAYHRMDFSATYESQRKSRFQGSWNFSLYNVYGRQNAYLINFKDDPNDATRTVAEQTSLFRWIPSVTYNFKF